MTIEERLDKIELYLERIDLEVGRIHDIVKLIVARPKEA